MATTAWFQYAWADATVAALDSWMWSGQYGASGMLQQLEQQPRHERAVKLYIKGHDDDDFLREFGTAEQACSWLRDSFRAEISAAEEERPATETAATFSNFWFGTCGTLSVAQDGEFLEDRAGPRASNGSEPQSLLNDSPKATPDGPTDLGDCFAGDDTTKAQYMYGDLYSKIARHNPARWSYLRSPESVAEELDQRPPARKILLRVVSARQRLHKMFPSPASAAVWLRKKFLRSKDMADLDEERLCVICMTEPRNVLLMPCRHAVLCEECLEVIMQRRPSECPICRKRIQNHARGHFADDYVELVKAAEARMELSQLQAYEGMYNHVRPLMVTGALLASGAAACFVVCPPLAPALLTSAAVVGYLPWFATTVAYFEGEDMAESSLQCQIFSREDLSSPLTLATKSLVLLVGAPVAGVVFFVPYGLYAGLLRPLSRWTLQALVRAACLAHVYVLRPAGSLAVATWELVSGMASTFGDTFMAGMQSFYDSVLCPLGAGVKWLGSRVADAARFTFRNVAVPIWDAMSSTATVAYERVLLPSAQTTWKLLQDAGCALYTYILVPTRHAFAVAAERLGVCAAGLYAYVILPVAHAAWTGLKAVCHGLGAAAHGTYEHILIPAGSAAAFVLKGLGYCLTSSAEALYSYVLQPLASSVYSYVVVPVGWAMHAVAGAISSGASAAAHALSQFAQLSYGYVLVPVGQAMQATGGAIWYASGVVADAVVKLGEACYSNVIRPCMNAGIQAAGAMYTLVLVPCGRAIAVAVQVVGNAVATTARVSGHAIYIYVVCPIGEASQSALIAGRQAVQQCQGAAVSAGQTVRVTVQSIVRR